MTAPGTGGPGGPQQPWPPGYPGGQQPMGYPGPQQPPGAPQPQAPTWNNPYMAPGPTGTNPYLAPGSEGSSPHPMAAAPGAGYPQAAPAPTPPVGPEEPQVLELKDTGRSGGMVKCSRCGSTDIRYVVEAQALVCSNCRTQFNEARLEDEVDLTGGIQDLRGTTITHSAQNLVDESVVTLKCRACGAEVVINVNETVQVRCHWCRNFLSADSRINNGASPDAVAPFMVPQEHAIEIIRGFVEERKFYAHPRFKREFAPENVVGVYLPYFVFDGNVRASLTGQGEVQTQSWTEKHGDSVETYYSADVYNVSRGFDMSIDDLLLESSSERANMNDPSQTNNIINAILPFDVKNALRYNPNYLRGFTSERRDVNFSDLGYTVQDRLLSIARSKGDEMVSQYDRGVRWDTEHIDLRGSRWVTVYLPVWLYSYYEADKNLKHFVAVNGQNGRVMGSVPLNMPVLWGVTALVFVIGTILGFILFLIVR